ncbi:hypothetical protein SAMN05192564_10136 [Paraburkholderia sartisoli]|uniref:Uncharacterized protein n=1 Tax=Paraburkholderia sartisoli TaxID=83784 RepID=A0A1H3XW33_9BURK|nr:hypothetical protein SAMN05192564_10136 [Paraburkholderia sartisoli]
MNARHRVPATGSARAMRTAILGTPARKTMPAPHAFASLAYSGAQSERSLTLRRRETRRAATRAARPRMQSRRSGTQRYLTCALPDSAAQHARYAAFFATRRSPPRRHGAAGCAREPRRTPACHRDRASRGRSRRPGTTRCARRNAGADVAENQARGLRMPLRRRWTAGIPKSCPRRGAHRRARACAPEPGAARGTMSALLRLSVSSAS